MKLKFLIIYFLFIWRQVVDGETQRQYSQTPRPVQVQPSTTLSPAEHLQEHEEENQMFNATQEKLAKQHMYEEEYDETDKVSQKVNCRPGRAIIDFSWTEHVKGYRKYAIKCGNITRSCREVCEYNIECRKKDYGDTLYIRGIWAIYNRFEDAQMSLYFLCCNGSNSTARSCSGRMQNKESHWMQSQIPFTFREARSTYGNDGETIVTNPQFYFEMCSTYVPQKDACPYVRVFLPNGPNAFVNAPPNPPIHGGMQGPIHAQGPPPPPPMQGPGPYGLQISGCDPSSSGNTINC